MRRTIYGTLSAVTAPPRLAQGGAICTLLVSGTVCWSAEEGGEGPPLFVGMGSSSECSQSATVMVDSSAGRLSRRGMVTVYAPVGWSLDPASGPDRVTLLFGGEAPTTADARLSEWTGAPAGTLIAPPGATAMWVDNRKVYTRLRLGVATTMQVPANVWSPASDVSYPLGSAGLVQWRVQ